MRNALIAAFITLRLFSVGAWNFSAGTTLGLGSGYTPSIERISLFARYRW